MKGILAFTCFVAVLALAAATPLCEKASDCKDDECCVAITANTVRGFCVKLRRERQLCSPPESQLSEFHGGKYLRFCPCQQSLKCVERGAKKESMLMAVKKVFRCQKEDATTTGPDQTTAPVEEGTTPAIDEATTPAIDEATTPAEPEVTEPEATEEPETTEPEEEGAPAQGPGGEKPRDDDCEDWELPC